VRGISGGSRGIGQQEVCFHTGRLETDMGRAGETPAGAQKG
jgi:hypothetical protein